MKHDNKDIYPIPKFLKPYIKSEKLSQLEKMMKSMREHKKIFATQLNTAAK